MYNSVAPAVQAEYPAAPESGLSVQARPDSFGVVALPQMVIVGSRSTSETTSGLPVQTHTPRAGLFGRLLRFRFGAAPDSYTPESPQTDIAECMEKRGFVRVAPRFLDQAEDSTRTNEFKYHHSSKGTMTEYAGLQQLSEFLLQHSQDTHLAKMREKLTFIGEKEYAEAAAGLAAYWKHHLESSDSAQLCLLSYISESRQVKSDRYMLERILEHFSDEELTRYRGKIVFDPSLLTAEPANVKIALIDDWMLSGSQMHAAIYTVQARLLATSNLQYLSSLEVNLIVVAQKRLYTQALLAGNSRVPIRGYYLAHDADGHVTCAGNSAYISGTHSTTDFDFGNKLRQYPYSPALAYVVRPYRRSSRPEYHRALKLLGLKAKQETSSDDW